MTLDRRACTVLTLRPGDDIRFATNRFHDTWHILSDLRGARALGRLLWGLAFQSRPGTLLVIDRSHLDTDPFDGGAADPIVLVPSDVTVLTRQAAADLARRLPLRIPSEGTVRWQTHGLDKATTERRAWRALGPDVDRYGGDYWQLCTPAPGWNRVERRNGSIVLAAGAAELRSWAIQVAMLGESWWHGSDYVYLDEDSGRCAANGEVQIFRQYRRMVTAAHRARTDFVARHGREPQAPDLPALWAEASRLRRNSIPAVPARAVRAVAV
ncbi:hypothetical protein [Nocardia stercoris]|uniref:Uncharacterized protein n=1 Tax=Nocardia stercoris TaxID=2483361 RepID=A0A3M2L4B0_9NOCA|nr:hypothetical protein [Nocardia stercoris]RMI32214.1 hypothetical protein EBN03_14535 [Nocardia stercoris]